MTNKNKDIEFLRAVAILFTLIVHLNALLLFPLAPLQWINTNFELSMGVDLFFVISGFVITRSLLDLSKNEAAPRHCLIFAFWIRRFFRLFPAAALWLAIAAIYLAALDLLRDNIAIVIAPLFNVMNIYNAYCVSHSDCGYFIHGHYWSLSLEEQFYLIYPLFFFFLPRHRLLLLVAAGIALQWFWLRPIWSYSWFIRTDAILWGVLIALLPHSIRSPIVLMSMPGTRVLLQIAGGALLILLPWMAKGVIGFEDTAKSYGVALTALLGAMLVWIAAQDRNLFYVGNRFSQWTLYFGSRSYSLYLSHLIVFCIVQHYSYKLAYNLNVPLANNLTWNLATMATEVLLTLCASEMTYRFIEQHLRDKGRIYAQYFLKNKTRLPTSQIVFRETNT